MRYFKWGVSRLILEPTLQPVLVPIFVTGFEEIMAETRGFPRFVPRVGKRVHIVFGAPVPEERFDDLRRAWYELWMREGGGRVEDNEVLRTGEAAVALRIETTRRVREEVAKVRRQAGYPEEEPGADDPDKYHHPGMMARDGRLDDGSMVKDT